MTNGKVVRTITCDKLKGYVIQHDPYTYSSIVSQGSVVMHTCEDTSFGMALRSAMDLIKDTLAEVPVADELIAADIAMTSLEGGRHE